MQIGGQPFLNLGLGDWIAFRIRIDVFSLRREFMAVPITVRCGTWNCDTGLSLDAFEEHGSHSSKMGSPLLKCDRIHDFH